MPGMLGLYWVDTSPRTDCALSLIAAVGTGGFAAWVGFEGGSPWIVGALLGLTAVLIAATAYARSLWRRAVARTEWSRERALRLRAFR